MIQRPIVMSAIALVVVAAILMLAILTVISSTNQAFAQAKFTTISLGANPNGGNVGCNTRTLPISLSGTLKSEGSGVDGATIRFGGAIIGGGTAEGLPGSATTDSGGHYGIQVRLGPGTHMITAIYTGDSDHRSSSVTTTITIGSTTC
jgi:hypothetical protein